MREVKQYIVVDLGTWCVDEECDDRTEAFRLAEEAARSNSDCRAFAVFERSGVVEPVNTIRWTQ